VPDDQLYLLKLLREDEQKNKYAVGNRVKIAYLFTVFFSVIPLISIFVISKKTYLEQIMAKKTV
jgi:hypothetical protein